MFKYLSTQVKASDFIGEAVTFTINGNRTFKTLFGGFLSILLYACYFYFFYIFGTDFILKKNPTVYFESKKTEETQNLTFTNKSFVFAFRMEDENQKTVNIDLYGYANLKYVNFNKALNKKK